MQASNDGFVQGFLVNLQAIGATIVLHAISSSSSGAQIQGSGGARAEVGTSSWYSLYSELTKNKEVAIDQVVEKAWRSLIQYGKLAK